MPERVVIPSRLDAVREVEEALLRRAVGLGYSDSAVFGIKLALEEAVNNAIKHGNGFDAAKTVEISFQIDPDRTVVVVTDQGRGFDPNDVPDPTSDENLEKPCGRGIMLMRAYMDEVCYNNTGNQVRLVKRNS